MKSGTLLPLACIFLLTACGGDGERVTSTPPPPPPPETYPDSANTDVRNLTLNETFTSDAIKGTASGNVTTGPLTSSAAVATDFSIRYDASDNAYTVSGSGSTFTFARSSFTVTPQNEFYIKTGNIDINDEAGSQGVILANPAKFNLSYVDMGYWKKGVRSGNILSTTVYPFSYGVETPNAAVPKTGSATYTTALVGVIADDEQGYYLLGGLQFIANFLAGSINLNGNAFGYDESGTRRAGFASLNGTGLISAASNSFNGTATANGFSPDIPGLSMSGTFTGRFYGPSAQEIGGTLLLSGSGLNAAGAFGGTTGTITK